MQQDEPTTIPYPYEFRTRLWQGHQDRWYCTLCGRPRNDAPYWHGGPAESAGEAFQLAYEASFRGFEGEGIRVQPQLDDAP